MKRKKNLTTAEQRNREWVRMQACLLCGAPQSDPHHWPKRHGAGAGWGLLEICPVCHPCHRAMHDGDRPKDGALRRLAPLWYNDVYESFHESGAYLGPPERVREFECERVHGPHEESEGDG